MLCIRNDRTSNQRQDVVQSHLKLDVGCKYFQHLESNKLRLRVKRALEQLSEPEHHNQHSFFVLRSRFNASFAGFEQSKLRLNLVIEFNSVGRVQQVENCWLHRLAEKFGAELVDAEHGLTDGVDMLPDQADLHVAVKERASLESSTQLEQDFGVSHWENLFIPLLDTLIDRRSFSGVAIHHLQDKLHDF